MREETSSKKLHCQNEKWMSLCFVLFSAFYFVSFFQMNTLKKISPEKEGREKKSTNTFGENEETILFFVIFFFLYSFSVELRYEKKNNKK